MEILPDVKKNRDICHFLKDDTRKFKFPHEFVFLEVLLKFEFKDYKVAEQFVAFVYQYYPDYSWRLINFSNFQDMAILESHWHWYVMNMCLNYKDGTQSQESYLKAKAFGEMATEFWIRNLGYNLLGVGGSNSVLTAQDKYKNKNNFDKLRRKKEMYLFKLRKLQYVKDDGLLLGQFNELPALPTKDLFINAEEYIENKEHKFERVLRDSSFDNY